MKESDNTILNVCFCFTDRSGSYYIHTLVALTSIFENTTARIRVHLICDDTLSEDSKQAFHRLVARYGHEVLIHAVPPISDAVVNNVKGDFGIGTVFRLFLPGIIQERSVLYLDCDVICTLDIQDVFAAKPASLPAAGAPDIGQRDDRESAARIRSLGLDPGYYVNSGVIVFDLERMRADYPDYTRATFASLEQQCLKYADQDALNIYFQNRRVDICALPEAFNFVVGLRDREFFMPEEYAGKILHYTRDKPWDALYPAALFYWKYYALAFSSEEAFAGMERLKKHKYTYLFNFILKTPKIRRMVNRALQISEQGMWSTLLDRLLPGRRKKRNAARRLG